MHVDVALLAHCTEGQGRRKEGTPTQATDDLSIYPGTWCKATRGPKGPSAT